MSQEDAPKFELLSVALGSEFSECSIAAAELNKQVYEELNGVGTRQKILLPIDEDPVFGRKFVTKRLDWTITSGDDEFRLALVRPADTAPGRSTIFRRVVENSVDVAGRHPQLVAILGDEDVFVSLATFARREGGQCSYVQLGAEMKDDNVFATTADEGSSRQDIIETIREVVGKAEDVPTKSLVSGLLTSELSGKEKELDTAKEAMLVRRAYERYKPREPLVLQVFDKETDSFKGQYFDTTSLYHGLELDDGRFVNLSLGRSGGNHLQLLATTRGNIALPVASFNELTGKVDLFDLESQLSEEQRRAIVSTLHHIVVKTFGTDSYEFSHNQNVRENKTPYYKRDLVIGRYLQSLGLLDFAERYHYKSDRLKLNGFNEDEVRTTIDEFLAYPTSTPPYNSQALQTFEKSRRKYNRDGINTCKLLNVEERLRTALGSCTPGEEILFSKVRSMISKGQVFTAVAHSLQLGKTRGDAKVVAKVQRDGASYRVAISGVPLAMPDEQPRPILRLNFDSTEALFNRDEYSDEAAATKAKDILDILNLF